MTHLCDSSRRARRDLITTLVLMPVIGLSVPAFAEGSSSPSSAKSSSPVELLPTIPVRLRADPPLPRKDSEFDSAPDFVVTWGGFFKLDAVYSRFSDGDVSALTGPRDYYVPSAIPVASNPADEQENSFLSVHAKDSRLWFKIDGSWAGHAVGGMMELDFRVNPGAYQTRTTNAYTPGLRKAYFTYDHWEFGQDFTTFRNNESIPESVDAIGPTEGEILDRQPLVRYTLGDWQFALESPETVVTAYGGGSVANATGDSVLPDAVVKYNLKTGLGSFAAATIVRQLRAQHYNLQPVSANGTTAGYGLSVSGKLPTFGHDDLRFTVTGGKGVGRYAGANTVDDAVITSAGGLEAIPVIDGFVAYHHLWVEDGSWRSNVTFSGLTAHNDVANTGTLPTKTVLSLRGNLLYSPLPKITFGVELLRASREIENGQHGGLNRLQFAAKFVF